MSFFIRREVLEQVEKHACQGFPYEICGFLGGTVLGQATALRPATNVSPQPAVEYNVAPEEILAALLAYEGQGLKLTGVYHSHPRYPARPSQTDIRLADLPGAIYLITSVYDGPDGSLKCETRAYRIEKGKAREAILEVS